VFFWFLKTANTTVDDDDENFNLYLVFFVLVFEVSVDHDEISHRVCRAMMRFSCEVR
jgi:hypothetical protein